MKLDPVKWHPLAIPFVLVTVLSVPLIFKPDVVQPHPRLARQSTMTESTVDKDMRDRIDFWLGRNQLNVYGDPPGTMYAGGTPLFDERSGVTKDRYVYILEHHPDLEKEEFR